MNKLIPIRRYYNLNNRIRSPKLQVVGKEGKNLGVMETFKALELAREQELDLVELSSKSDPPIAKIMDFGHFLYEQKKKEQKARVRAKKSETKGIRLSLRISGHDKALRVVQSKKFLNQGHKVKVEMKLVGRERQHADLAKNIINEFVSDLNGEIVLEQPLAQQGGRLSLIVRKK